MKRLLIALLLFGYGYAEGATLTPVMTEVCSYTNATASAYQGMVYDGTNFFVGNNNDNKIYKFDSSCNLVTSFASANYSPGMDIRKDHDNIIVSSGGANDLVIWEITKTGTKVREWDLHTDTDHVYAQYGCGVTYVKENTVLVCSANQPTNWDFRIAEYTLADNGTWTWVKTWSNSTLGTSQGIWWEPVSERLYYGVTVTPGTDNRIYELKLSASATTISTLNYANVTTAAYTEIESMSVYGTDMYFNTWVNGGPYYIYKIGYYDLFSPRGSKFNNLVLGNNPSGIVKWNGVKWGQVSGSVNKINNIAKSNYYCNIESVTGCKDPSSGGDLLCEVWKNNDTPPTDAGNCGNWTKVTSFAQCTIKFNQTPDNDPALGCTDIRNASGDMTYVFELDKANANSAPCGTYVDLGAGQTKYFLQFYFKVVTDALTNTQGIGLMSIMAAATGNHPIVVRLYHDTTNLLLQVGYNNGSWTWTTGETVIATDTWYGVRVQYDESANHEATVFKWWMDASNDGTWTSKADTTFHVPDIRRSPRYALVGEVGNTTVQVKYQIAGIKMSAIGFVGGCER